MADQYVAIRGIDPLLFRDGRPFGAELGALAAQTLPLPLPGTLSGLLRTRVGDHAGWNWKTDGPRKALAVPVAGPILQRNGATVFAAPADALIYEDKPGTPEVMTLRPCRTHPTGAGCNLPDSLTALAVTRDAKPESGYNYWSLDAMETWLLDAAGKGFEVPEKIIGPKRDDRTHVKIDAGTGASEEGMLFTTRTLCFEDYTCETGNLTEWSLLARVGHDIAPTGGGPFGGERRIAAIEPAQAAAWPVCPPRVRDALKGCTLVRMILATPALFSGGWRPGWLDDLGAVVPELAGLKLALRAAAVKRREPVSGWDYERRGPKPVRWMAPAGSVYFFEVMAGDAHACADCWLQPVSDTPQDRNDGYGLALWGVWNWNEQGDTK